MSVFTEAIVVLVIGAALLVVGAGARVLLGNRGVVPVRVSGTTMLMGVLVIAAGIALLMGVRDLLSPAPAATSAPAQSALTPSAAATTAPPVVLAFNPPGSTVPMCADFTGTGTVPGGKVLLIFDKAEKDSRQYWYNGVAHASEGGWTAKNVQVGDPAEAGLRVEIFAVLVDKSVADYIASIDSGTEEPWFSTSLPGTPVDSIIVERNSTATPCP